MKTLSVNPILVFLCLLVFQPMSQASAMTLNECVELALRNNPEMAKQKVNLETTQADLADRQGQKYGKLNLVSSYTHYNLPHTLAPLTPGAIASNPLAVPTTEDLFVAGINYEVQLFTGFAQTRSVEVAALQRELAAAALTLSKEQLIYNVKSLYVNILSLQEQASAQAAYVRSSQQLYEQISHELTFGRKALVDQLKAAADLQNARARLVQINADIDILSGSLASQLNIEAIPPLQKFDLTVDNPQPLQGDFVDQLKTTERLRAAELTVRKDAKLVQKAAAGLYPQIALNVAYGQNFGPNDSSHADSGNWNNQDLWQGGLSLKWTVFDFGSTQSKIRKARFVEQHSRHQQTQAKLELKRAVKEAVTKINTSVSDYQSAQSERELTQRTAAIEQVRFDKGATSLNDLLYAKARHQLAESRFIAAGYAYEVAGYYLQYLLETGESR
ncbi:Outer membrane protein TolC [Desulfuromusa kysingii]|uniref:Outer membrane protein TolC n=1 Tax=Desulfuromusa kysingii TaxID=37625 RepID=A0A1H4DRT7_9BACT|nr:TolC family protein [Desulfuromusa kysingii]SEA75219.1 Outer membrane protein TolC [Desulfuromusa kysingii]